MLISVYLFIQFFSASYIGKLSIFDVILFAFVARIVVLVLRGSFLMFFIG